MKEFTIKPIAQNSIRCESANDKGRLKVIDTDNGLTIVPDKDMNIYFNEDAGSLLITEEELDDRLTGPGTSGRYKLINPTK